jgi:hypothetical protein
MSELVSETKSWIKNREDVIKKLKAMKPKDRLAAYSALAEVTLYVTQSSAGWMRWLTDPTFMNSFDEVQLKSMLDMMKKAAVSYIQADIDATKLFPKKPLNEIIKEKAPVMFQ